MNRVKEWLGCLLWLLVCVCATGQASSSSYYQPGQSYFGRSNYIQYIAGDLPIIFSAPHGGELEPGEIPDRTCTNGDSDFATITDAHTVELALAMHERLRGYFGRSPHVVICHLKRSKVDCNREAREAAGGNAQAEQAWKEFQGFLSAASNTVARTAAGGLYIDLHSQSNPIKRLELGYLLTAGHLTNSDMTLDQGNWFTRSSLRSLARKTRVPFSELLRGSNSFGGLLEAQGYPSVPSPAMPNPGNGTDPVQYPGDRNPYYHGGYNLRVHSSFRAGGRIDGLQLEANFKGVRDTSANRAKFCLAVAETLDRFFVKHYGIDLKARPGSEAQ